jgi:hypothetical protein
MLQDWFATMYGVLHGAQGPLFVEVIYPQSGAMLFACRPLLLRDRHDDGSVQHAAPLVPDHGGQLCRVPAQRVRDLSLRR